MLVIGLTGNVASGKSSVARVWREMGAVVLDADRIGHTVLSHGSEVLGRVVEVFGPGILTGGSLDREVLAREAFRDRDSVRKLDRIVHPAIRQEIGKRLEEERRLGTAMVVVEAALIFEAEIEDDFDVIVVVHAPLERRMKWVSRKRGIDEPGALRIEKAQMNPGTKAKRGDFVIENQGTLTDLKRAARAMLEEIMEKYQIEGGRC